MSGLGSENGWIGIDDAVRPRVLLVAANPGDLAHLMDLARRLARRARVEIAVPNARRFEPPVYTVGGVTVHRFLWRTGLAAWLAAYAGRYEAVHVHAAGRRSLLSLAAATASCVVRTDAEDEPGSLEDTAQLIFTRGVGVVA